LKAERVEKSASTKVLAVKTGFFFLPVG